MSQKLLIISFLLASVFQVLPVAELIAQDGTIPEFNRISQEYLQRLIDGEDTADIREKLATTSLSELENGLRTDEEKLAFWINIYNAYILEILRENPEKYNDRREFFKAEQIPIAGRRISFEKIEHGIIRKSQWPYGLGLIRKWFPNKFERKLRVSERDFRIHFALNCGAKDCPPVAIYAPERLDQQLDTGTKQYLERTTSFNESTATARVSSLFNWFRGDFGCKSGVRDILRDYGIVPETREKLSIEYTNYDWTLDLNNFTEL